MGGGMQRLPHRPSPSPILRLSFSGPSFPSAPLFPAKLLLLKGPGFPSPPPIAGRGAAGLTPLPLGLFPLPLPRRPRACTGWTLRGGRGPRRPLPVCPVGIRPGAGTKEGGGRGPGAAVQTCFLPPAAAAARAPMCGCVPRPAHPPHLPARRVGAALKGLGVGLRRQGIGAEEGGRGWGRGAQCRRVSHVRPTYSPTPTGSRAAGPWGQQEPRLARGGDQGSQTTPPCLPSVLRALA